MPWQFANDERIILLVKKRERKSPMRLHQLSLGNFSDNSVIIFTDDETHACSYFIIIVNKVAALISHYIATGRGSQVVMTLV